jgi:hypothetical protein
MHLTMPAAGMRMLLPAGSSCFTTELGGSLLLLKVATLHLGRRSFWPRGPDLAKHGLIGNLRHGLIENLRAVDLLN